MALIPAARLLALLEVHDLEASAGLVPPSFDQGLQGRLDILGRVWMKDDSPSRFVQLVGIHPERDTKRPRSFDVQFREPPNSGADKHMFRQFVDWARRERILPRFGVNSVDIDNVGIVGWRLARSGLSFC